MSGVRLTEGERAALVERARTFGYETPHSLASDFYPTILRIVTARQADAWDLAHEDFCVVAGQMRCDLHNNPFSPEVIDRCQHGAPEATCAACASCAACDGSCGTCPYVVTPPGEIS